METLADRLNQYERERHHNHDRLITLPLPWRPAKLLDYEENRIYENWSMDIQTRVPSKWHIWHDNQWKPLAAGWN